MNGARRDLRGKTVVITGASAGIGAAAAAEFAGLGATVAVVGRSPEKTTKVSDRVGGRAHLVDFGSLQDVRRLAAELLESYERIDVLANNAGAMFTSRNTSVDGHELTLQVNLLAPFLLTNLLLDRLTGNQDGARVVNTGSLQYRKGRLDLDDLDSEQGRFRGMRAYGTSKLGTILFTAELARRTEGTGLTTAAFHPGGVATEVTRDSAWQHAVMKSSLGKKMILTPEQGAEPLLRMATAVDMQSFNGQYFNRLKHEEPRNPQARDEDLGRRLWERVAEMSGVPSYEPRRSPIRVPVHAQSADGGHLR